MCIARLYSTRSSSIVILDGLDSISTDEEGSKMICAIENCLENYAQTSLEHSLSDEPYRSEGN